MNTPNAPFGILGARPRFKEAIPIGQLYFPSWDRYEAAFRGIFERQYYNNNGPLLTELETRLQDFLGVKHVLCTTNATLALMMAADALELSGKVIMPSFTFVASAESLKWAGVEPLFCDVNPATHQIDIDAIAPLIDEHVSGIMGVNLWGGCCDPMALEEIAHRYGIKLYFDSAHAFGCEFNGRNIAGFGDLEVFSFHATKVLSATEGGCICTDNDDLADRLRGIRPSYGEFNPAKITRVANARMSEAQAAIALMNLEDFPKNRQKNEAIFHAYDKGLEQIPGIRLVRPSGVSLSNYQYVVCEVDEKVYGLSRDDLIAVLKEENVIARRYFYPGVHQTIGFRESFSDMGGSLPVTERLCQICIQLPVGALVDEDQVDGICELIGDAHTHARTLKRHLPEHA